MRLRIAVLDAAKAIRSQASGEAEVCLVYRACYAPGDEIGVEAAAPGAHLVVQLDDAMLPAQVYLAGTSFTLPIPFDAGRKVYSPKAFCGALHRLSVRAALPYEVASVRNLALNPYDGGPNPMLFPHCEANVLTRNEAVFAARNAIDGEKATDNHGFWPYTSWGINRDPNATLTLTFGRQVLLRALVLYLRADFPHDAWWRQADVTFSNGDSETLELAKTGAAQRFTFVERLADWIRLDRLVKADDPSPFPALTQLEAWGRDLVKTNMFQ